jgi:hypothetical protein
MRGYRFYGLPFKRDYLNGTADSKPPGKVQAELDAVATENAENVTDSGGEVTSAYVDWETLEMLDDDGIPSEES